MSQLKIRGSEDFVYDSDEAEISDEDEDALRQLPLHKGGGLFDHLKSSIKEGNYYMGGGYWGGDLQRQCVILEAQMLLLHPLARMAAECC